MYQAVEIRSNRPLDQSSLRRLSVITGSGTSCDKIVCPVPRRGTEGSGRSLASKAFVSPASEAFKDEEGSGLPR